MSKIRVEQGYRKNLTKSSNKVDITKGNSEWEGWGTALKPACEPIVVARKPLSEKNVALNVLKHNTGGINIDACRINTREKDMKQGEYKGSEVQICPSPTSAKVYPKEQGRFPSNVIHDGSDIILKNFPDVEEYDKSIQKTLAGDIVDKQIINSSRFFYVAKASRSERNAGLDIIQSKKRDLSRRHGQAGTDNPFNRGAEAIKNNHPTVKPIKLMQYLIKLVTREGALVLDPFIGSGTTAIACYKTHRNFIGIEKEPEYVKIAEARLKPYLEQQKLKEFEK